MKKLILSTLVALSMVSLTAFAGNFVYYPQEIICKNHDCPMPSGFILMGGASNAKDGIYTLRTITASLNGNNTGLYSFGIPGFGERMVTLQGQKMYPAIKQPGSGWHLNNANDLYQCVNLASTCPLTTQK